MKNNKGITLIALIITIVVLLILAMVAISAVSDNGIIAKAQKAKDLYGNEANKENQTIEGYATELGKYGVDGGEGGATGGVANDWTQNGITVTSGTTTLTVGDYVDNYEVEGYSGKWQVLGEENGQLLLLSEDNVESNFNLSGKDGANNGVQKLNEACAKYLNSEYATEARSINVEDVNRITGYNPTGYESGNIWAYGNRVTYSINNGYVKTVSENGVGSEEQSSWAQSFTTPSGETATEENPITVESTAYWYQPTRTNEAWYKMLFGESSNKYYWLASPCVGAGSGSANFGLRDVYYGGVDYGNLWSSNGGAYGGYLGARAVVSLRSDINLTKDTSTGNWRLEK